MGRPPSNGGPSFRFTQAELWGFWCFEWLICPKDGSLWFKKMVECVFDAERAPDSCGILTSYR
ncbi:hypothetical protein HanHA300_Chr10g0369871 [Helianthus annuus]|nr:hypothetical protein HanHA300_Chr10g0369871 [Helianthus annuus]KAJ0700859.1 hypothetical protein HanOQP8_Chr10g0372841 [Helianthus annuus]